LTDTGPKLHFLGGTKTCLKCRLQQSHTEALDFAERKTPARAASLAEIIPSTTPPQWTDRIMGETEAALAEIFTERTGSLTAKLHQNGLAQSLDERDFRREFRHQ
jgi:hypothetical protein